jgi:CheY-like chemotaxis protein
MTDEKRNIALVVDDIELLRGLTSRVAERKGYTVHTAADGIEALDRALQHGPYALVITDHDMPQRKPENSGSTFLEKYNQSFPGNRTAIIGVTGNYENIGYFERAGAHLVILKPYTPMEILNAIDTAVQRLSKSLDNKK